MRTRRGFLLASLEVPTKKVIHYKQLYGRVLFEGTQHENPTFAGGIEHLSVFLIAGFNATGLGTRGVTVRDLEIDHPCLLGTAKMGGEYAIRSSVCALRAFCLAAEANRSCKLCQKYLP